AGGTAGFAGAGGAVGAAGAGAGCFGAAPPPAPRLTTTGGGFATSPVGAASPSVCAASLPSGAGDSAGTAPPPATTISCPAVDARLEGVIAGPTAAPIRTPDASTTTPTAPKE